MSKLVFKILPPSATFYGLDYNERKCKKGSARLLHYGNFGLLHSKSLPPSKKSMKTYMDLISSSNKRIRNKQFHAIMSCKGQMFSFAQLKSHAIQIMNGLGYENNPIAIYGHTDTENNHVHIVTTRVGIDGKKIAHHFEGRRANDLLNQVLHTDKKHLFNAELDHALGYSFSTVAQFRLLMEQKGYQVKMMDNYLDFFRYGAKLATIPTQTVISKINPEIPANLQMKAIIKKYKNPHNCGRMQSSKEKYSTAKQEYQTSLTEELYKKFGWQFVFFKNSKHEKPYGFVIIDHHNKIVHKGSNIIPLEELLLSTGEALKPIASISKECVLSVHQEKTTTAEIERISQTKGTDPANPSITIDRIIGQTEFDAEQELNKAQDPKRKRGRYL